MTFGIYHNENKPGKCFICGKKLKEGDMISAFVLPDGNMVAVHDNCGHTKMKESKTNKKKQRGLVTF